MKNSPMFALDEYSNLVKIFKHTDTLQVHMISDQIKNKKTYTCIDIHYLIDKRQCIQFAHPF